MTLSRTIAILTGLTAIVASTWGMVAIARPYPDEIGICYRFQDDTLDRHQPCIISAGYGADAHYATLHWSEDDTTTIYMVTFCNDQDNDDLGFCAYLIDDDDAEPYERNTFLDIATVDDPDNLTCYRAIATNESICYRFSE